MTISLPAEHDGILPEPLTAAEAEHIYAPDAEWEKIEQTLAGGAIHEA